MSSWDWDEGYDLDDPKHSTFRERYAEAADNARKRDREGRPWTWGDLAQTSYDIQQLPEVPDAS